MNAFEQYNDLHSKAREVYNKIRIGLSKYVRDHADEIYPDNPYSVIFSFHCMTQGKLYISVSVGSGDEAHIKEFEVKMEDALKYIE